MEIPKQVLSLHLCASTDKTRPGLNTVHIELDGTALAIDGAILVALRNVYGTVEGKAVTNDKPVTLTAESCRAALKLMPKLSSVASAVVTVGEDLRIAQHDSVSTYLLAPKDDTFPDWRRIIPPEPPQEFVGFSLEALQKVIDTAKSQGCKAIALGSRGPHRPAHFVGIGSYRDTLLPVEGVIMPYALGKDFKPELFLQPPTEAVESD